MRGLSDELVGLALSISFIGHCTDEPDDAQLPKVGVETKHDDNASRTYHGSFSPSLNGETPSLSKLTVECLSFLDFFFWRIHTLTFHVTHLGILIAYHGIQAIGRRRHGKRPKSTFGHAQLGEVVRCRAFEDEPVFLPRSHHIFIRGPWRLECRDDDTAGRFETESQ
jgi:hypothetical protein